MLSALMCGLIADPVPGGLLQPGMELVYASNGRDQFPWRILTVRPDSALRGESACVTISQRRQAGEGPPEESQFCLANDTLYSWNVEQNEWRIARPVGAGMVYETSRPNGDIIRYETGETREEKLSGLTIPVVLTTVLTSDSSGHPKRRLRERYSLGLVTATGGVFETPDSTAPGGWRVQQEFELRTIRMP